MNKPTYRLKAIRAKQTIKGLEEGKVYLGIANKHFYYVPSFDISYLESRFDILNPN